MLGRILERMARLVPPHHRELVRGMVAELDSIVDPAERARFALGAVAAIARLAVIGHGTVAASTRFDEIGKPGAGANDEGPSRSTLTARQLLLRHGTPFVLSLASLTVLLLAQDAGRWAPQLSARGAPDGTILEVLLLAVPHTLALTIPMAVFLAVSWVFMRLGAGGALTSARRERRGIRRLVTPVLGASAVVATFAFVSNTEILPRANARLAAVLAGAPREPTDRSMTIRELRAAAEEARIADGRETSSLVARYEVEIQKKFAISAACVFLALAAAAIAIRFPGGGGKLVLAASNLVFIGYYLLLVAGEFLADEQVLSPLVAMWMANAILLAVALFLVRRPTPPRPPEEAGALAIDR